jgi:pSer/pThr/pTyr-binding forkhead associated (FHA) protein
MTDPVVGWLVVISGPGQGRTLRLGHGMNSIGRGEGQRCRLDFGDTEISRNLHATVTYDPRGRKFYLMHGGGQNLTYLGENPVLQPVVLSGGELISLGKTTLKFVALCGPDFDWSAQPVTAS